MTATLFLETKPSNVNNVDNKNPTDERAEEPSIITTLRESAIFVGEVVVLLVRVIITWCYCFYQFCVPPDPKDVKGDVVLITGTGHGIGRELALRFAGLGAIVVCVDINEKGNQETLNMIKEFKGTAHSYRCDVTDRQSVMEMASHIRKEVGEVVILVNNAGIMPCRSVLDHSEKEVRSVMDINVVGNIWMIQAFLPTMMERNYGHIVSISSMAGLMGIRNLVPYCASKYGVRGLMEALKLELAEDERNFTGIQFTNVCPMIVNTGLCHKPRIKRPRLINMVEPGDAADQIVNAVRRNYLEITVPSDLYYTNKIYRLIPFPVAMVFNEFFGTGVDAHD